MENCKFTIANPFHCTSGGCQLLDNVHIYNMIAYSQTSKGYIENWHKIHGPPEDRELLRSRDCLSGRLTLNNFDANQYLSYDEIAYQLRGSGHANFQRTWHGLLIEILHCNSNFLRENSGGLDQIALDPKCLFDIYVQAGKLNTVYFFRPILTHPMKSDYFKRFRNAVLAFFEMIGQSSWCIFETNSINITAKMLKNKISPCNLIDSHFNKSLHLRQLKCIKGRKKTNKKFIKNRKIQGGYQHYKNTNDAGGLIDATNDVVGTEMTLHQSHNCWLGYKNVLNKRAVISSGNLDETNVIDKNLRECEHHCLITANIYRGFSLIYRNYKMHTFFCTPDFLLNADWYWEFIGCLVSSSSLTAIIE